MAYRYELVRIQFLQAYLERLDGAASVLVWPSFLNVVKEIVANPSAHKYRLFPFLRCYASISEHIAQTSALEDRRMKRDLHVRARYIELQVTFAQQFTAECLVSLLVSARTPSSGWSTPQSRCPVDPATV